MMKNSLQKVKSAVNEKNISVLMLLLVIGFLVPIYLFACYTVPLADDFCMAGPSYRAWVESGSIWQAIVAAGEQTIYQYMNWAGEYVCMFLQALPIGLGSYRLYFVSSWINTSIFVFSVYYAGKIFFVEYLHADKKKYFIVTTIVLLYMVTFIPELYDAFYWHTTVVSYTLSFAVKLIILAGMFKSLFIREVSRGMMAVLLILSFAAAGFECSFSQTSFFLIVTAFLCIACVMKKNVKLAGAYWFLTTAGWGLALLAPGNMARQDSNYGGTTSVIAVLWESMHRGMDGISENIGLILILVTLLILPFVYKMVKQSEKSFLLPGLLSLYSIAIYASTYAPWIFSRGTEAPSPYGGDSGYVRNVFWMTFVLLWFVNVIYWTGWVAKTFQISITDNEHKKIQNTQILYYGVVLFLMLFWSVKLEHVMEYTSPRLLWHIANGNANAYYTAMEAREERLLSDTEELIVVPKVEMPIPTRGAGDILSDETHWVNEGVKAYYRLKRGVKLEE